MDIVKEIFASTDKKFTILLSTIVFCCKAKKPSTDQVLDFVSLINNKK